MVRYVSCKTNVFPQRELRNRIVAIMAAVVAGETCLVTRNGIPVAELRPTTRARRTFVAKATVAALAADGPQIDAVVFRDDSDRIMDQCL